MTHAPTVEARGVLLFFGQASLASGRLVSTPGSNGLINLEVTVAKSNLVSLDSLHVVSSRSLSLCAYSFHSRAGQYV